MNIPSNFFTWENVMWFGCENQTVDIAQSSLYLCSYLLLLKYMMYNVHCK